MDFLVLFLLGSYYDENVQVKRRVLAIWEKHILSVIVLYEA